MELDVSLIKTCSFLYLYQLVVTNPHACSPGCDIAGQAVSCLRRSEDLLKQHMKGIEQGSGSACENLNRIKDSAQDLNQQLVRWANKSTSHLWLSLCVLNLPQGIGFQNLNDCCYKR